MVNNLSRRPRRWLAGLLHRCEDLMREGATKSEFALVRELRSLFAELPGAPAPSNSEAESTWNRFRSELRNSVIHQDARCFLRWDVIQKTMFVSNAPFARKEFASLKIDEHWRTVWKEAIEEDLCGHPKPFFLHPRSSGNRIHQAYHLAQFQQRSGIGFRDLKFIFEFGGGYGGMCRIVHKLGFAGKYVIFDFPEMCLLQRFYLRCVGLPAAYFTTDDRTDNAIVLTSCLEDLHQVIAETKTGRSLLIATWSLSEAPAALRRTILQEVAGFGSFLISYQDRFGEEDNQLFFKNWTSSLPPDIQWSDWPLTHLPGNRYLMGFRRNAFSANLPASG